MGFLLVKMILLRSVMHLELSCSRRPLKWTSWVVPDGLYDGRQVDGHSYGRLVCVPDGLYDGRQVDGLYKGRLLCFNRNRSLESYSDPNSVFYCYSNSETYLLAASLF